MSKPDAAIASAVYRILTEDFPVSALGWVHAAHWEGPTKVPTDQIDYTHEASWTATREPRKIRDFVRSIKDDPSSLKPLILVKTPGAKKYVVLDGHHRALAYRDAGVDAYAYIAFVGADAGPWDELHSSQYTGPSKLKVARVAAADAGGATLLADREGAAAIGVVRNAQGAYLTVSRPESPHEMAIPGGIIDAGETPLAAMSRELSEETGIHATSAQQCAELKSPTDGRTVLVFTVSEWTGIPEALEEGTKIAWLTADQLLTQASLFKPSVQALIDCKVLCDLGVSDVHTPSASSPPRPKEPTSMTTSVAMISAAKRKGLDNSQFAWPEQRKFPIDTAARVRNAAARLAQGVKQGRISKEQAAKIHARIVTAGKKFGVEITSDDDGHGSTPPAGGRLHVRADLAHGGSLHISHHVMTDAAGVRGIEALKDGTFRMRDMRDIQQGAEVDPATLGIKLKGAPAWKDGTPKKLVWIQLAQVGSWKGHPAGPFEMTPKTFDDIVRNFDDRGLPIACDFEHASEAEPTEGSIPTNGAPAQGWAHRLENRGIGGLWGLVEWLDLAREGIKAGNYGFLSPAIRFGSKDPVTGAPAGARLTSFAITNSPFLNGIGGLVAAKDNGGGVTTTSIVLGDKGKMGKPVHSTSEYMPGVRQALKMDALCSPRECADKLDRLRDLCMTAGMDGSFQGEDLGSYTKALRQMVDAPLGMTVEEMFDIVEDMIANAIEEHEEQYHSGETPMTDKTVSELTTLLSTKDGEVTALNTKVTTLDGQVTALKLKVTETSDALIAMTTKFNEASGALATMTERATTAEKSLETVQASLKLKETELQATSTEVVTLRDAAKKRADDDIVLEVDLAFEAYKDQRKLTDASKDTMLIVAKNDIEKFRKEYPPVAAHHMHMLRSIAGEGKRPPVEQRDVPGAEKSYDEQLAELQAQGLSHSAAVLRLSQRK